jgi:hypothetical protein
MARGAVRRGETLLAGLLRGGHCGRKLHVAPSGLCPCTTACSSVSLPVIWRSSARTSIRRRQPGRETLLRTEIQAPIATSRAAPPVRVQLSTIRTVAPRYRLSNWLVPAAASRAAAWPGRRLCQAGRRAAPGIAFEFADLRLELAILRWEDGYTVAKIPQILVLLCARLTESDAPKVTVRSSLIAVMPFSRRSMIAVRVSP